jgi:hypothetical protein
VNAWTQNLKEGKAKRGLRVGLHGEQAFSRVLMRPNSQARDAFSFLGDCICSLDPVILDHNALDSDEPQNLPQEAKEKEAAHTIRGCFVPGKNNVFIDSDFSQIELVVLAYVLKNSSACTRSWPNSSTAARMFTGSLRPTFLGKTPRRSPSKNATP